MLKANQIFLAMAAILSVGLSGCGKDKYDGTYTGYEIRSYGTTGQTTQQNMGYSSARAVTMTLTNNGDLVSGTYQVTATNTYGGMGGSYGNESYQFSASSQQSGQLTNVMLISTGGYSQYSNCLMQGSLSSQNHGQTVSGTLTAAASGASNCGSLQITLNRGN